MKLSKNTSIMIDIHRLRVQIINACVYNNETNLITFWSVVKLDFGDIHIFPCKCIHNGHIVAQVLANIHVYVARYLTQDGHGVLNFTSSCIHPLTKRHPPESILCDPRHRDRGEILDGR